MSGTYKIAVGDRGRVVIPLELRTARGWAEGTALLAVETARGVILTTQSELEALVRSQFAGSDALAELLTERRAAALADDAS